MSVPDSVRNVPRPKNTVVVDTKTNGPKRYQLESVANTRVARTKTQVLGMEKLLAIL